MSLRQQLKGATASEHKALEARLALTSETVSLDDYVRYLHCTYSYYAAVEPVLTHNRRFAALGLHIRFGHKLETLKHDLAFFGASTPSPSAAAYVPDANAAPELLGCSYVLEGASLGGLVLYRHFEQRFGVVRSGGATFFYGDGQETPRTWARFVKVLDETVLTEVAQQACLGAARATFSGMDAWFAENGWGVS